ncbi:hypothetical protein CZ794_05210 [Psychrobacter sp. JB385]|nr:hypothetical protein CZ794_05210 [Psychrobacter sp. JB385]
MPSDNKLIIIANKNILIAKDVVLIRDDKDNPVLTIKLRSIDKTNLLAW